MKCPPALADIETDADRERFKREAIKKAEDDKKAKDLEFEKWLKAKNAPPATPPVIPSSPGVPGAVPPAVIPPPFDASGVIPATPAFIPLIPLEPPITNILGDYEDDFKKMLGLFNVRESDIDKITEATKTKSPFPLSAQEPLFNRIEMIESLLPKLGTGIEALNRDEAMSILDPLEDTMDNIYEDLKRICIYRYQDNYIHTDFSNIGLDFKIGRRKASRIYAIALDNVTR